MNKLAVLIGSGILLVAVGCKKSEPTPGAAGGTAAGQPAGSAAATANRQKLSQFDKAGFCDIAVAADGALHAVFTDQPDYNKPHYLYHRSSADGGKTWSEPKNLSDDETGNGVGFARVVVDGKGRVYAVWKYVDRNTLLEGPGGYAPGAVAYRCLEGGSWSKRVRLGDEKFISYSWFAAIDPNGGAHVVWSQIAKDAAAAGSQYWNIANQVRQAALDGTTVTSVKDVITPKPLLTQADLDAQRAAGQTVAYDDTRPKRNGLLNLRGHVDAAGTARFLAEDPGVDEGPSDQQTGPRIQYWDGQKLNPLYAFNRIETHNNFNNPPALLLDAQGKPFMVRSPEKSEKAVIRVYPIENGKLGDFEEPIAAKGGKGAIYNWQAYQLPGGRMAIFAALSEKGGYNPGDTEIVLSLFENGKWSEPRKVTNVSTQGKFAYTEGAGGNAISSGSTYDPRFAAVAVDKAGGLNMLAVINESSLFGFTTTGVTSSGRAVTGTTGGRVDSPQVIFQKL